MWNKCYNRRKYWIWVCALLLLKIAAIFAIQINPGLLSLAGHVDTGIGVALAIVVGARFADAGWSRWLGVGLVILIFVVLPILVVLPFLSGMDPKDPLAAMPPHMAIVTVALLALLIIAGIPKTVEVP